MTLFHKTKINIQKAREKRKKLSHSLKVFFLVLDEQNFYFYYRCGERGDTESVSEVTWLIILTKRVNTWLNTIGVSCKKLTTKQIKNLHSKRFTVWTTLRSALFRPRQVCYTFSESFVDTSHLSDTKKGIRLAQGPPIDKGIIMEG